MPAAAPERTVTGSRGKSLRSLLASALLAAAALWDLSRPGPGDWRAWLGLLLFGPGTLLFAWLLVRPQRLRLDADGFTVAGGLVRTPSPVRWTDADGFFLYRLPRGGRMIGFDYVPGARPASALSG